MLLLLVLLLLLLLLLLLHIEDEIQQKYLFDCDEMLEMCKKGKLHWCPSAQDKKVLHDEVHDALGVLLGCTSSPPLLSSEDRR